MSMSLNLMKIKNTAALKSKNKNCDWLVFCCYFSNKKNTEKALECVVVAMFCLLHYITTLLFMYIFTYYFFFMYEEKSLDYNFCSQFFCTCATF